MRLIDLLRSRSRAADAAGASDTGYLRESDMAALYDGDAGITGNLPGQADRNGDAGGQNGDSGLPGDSTAAATGEKSPASDPVPRNSDGIQLDEWPDDPVDAYPDTSEFLEADAVHGEVMSVLGQAYDEGERGEPINVDSLTSPIMHLVDICGRTDTILRKAVRMTRGPISFPQHSLDTAITSIKTAIVRGYDEDRLFQIALCALLGDVGMTRVNPDILEKTGKLSSGEFSLIQEHVGASLEIVERLADRFPFLPVVIGQIHERENGSGYPAGLKGGGIHEYARIIGMCDVYTALTEPKVNREKYSGFVALQQIISRRGQDFNAGMIKSLIEVIGIFPLESLVKLNNGLIGRVIGICSVHPTRPRLSVLVDADGARLPDPYLLDLEHEPLLYIEDPDIEEGAVPNR